MSFLLDSTVIRRPMAVEEKNSSQFAQQRTLSGAIARDYFGDNKRSWRLSYSNVQKAEYDVIKAIYDSYLATETEKSWEVTESNYTVAATTVHMDLQERGFKTPGSSFLSEFDLILTEA